MDKYFNPRKEFQISNMRVSGEGSTPFTSKLAPLQTSLIENTRSASYLLRDLHRLVAEEVIKNY